MVLKPTCRFGMIFCFQTRWTECAFQKLDSFGGPDDERSAHSRKTYRDEYDTLVYHTCSRIVTVTSSCNAEVSNNVTYFVNPKFPGLLNDVGECSLRVKKVSKDISQIRLDFVNFNLVSVVAGVERPENK